MPESVLSQDEMDALLRGVETGQVAMGPLPTKTGGVRSYDLTNVNRYITLPPQKAMEVVSARLVSLFQSSISMTFRKNVTVKMVLVELSSFDSFLEKVPPMSSFHLLKIEPLTEKGLLVMTANLVYFLLEHFYGGGGNLYARHEGDYTLIEKRFIRKIVESLLTELQTAWQPVCPVTVTPLRMDSNVKAMRILPDKDWVVIARFKLTMEEAGDEFFFCLPFLHLEPLREKLYGGPENALNPVTESWETILQHHVKENARVAVSVLLGTATLTVPEIVQLEVGDIITLDRSVKSDLELMVENRPKFYGRPGVYKKGQAFQIRTVKRA